jgi:hypothetical protein
VIPLGEFWEAADEFEIADNALKQNLDTLDTAKREPSIPVSVRNGKTWRHKINPPGHAGNL